MRCVLVANGVDPASSGGTGALTANARLNAILGARVEYVATRGERAPRMASIAAALSESGARPFVIPIGASTPLGALGYVAALVELSRQVDPPDVIVHSTSSAGTQAGLVSGCRLLGWRTRVIGVSADDPVASIHQQVAVLIDGIGELLGAREAVEEGTAIEVDDAFVGEGYGKPTAASTEAIELTARTEGLFLDPTYTAKAMAALIAYIRAGRFSKSQTILFWHTGGQVGLFA
jgi:1-aminocyclopropane-1-carboxylate deaminase/D-cysteine desulfhydrase-like pyridoxal-dependent ACC family enzyme